MWTFQQPRHEKANGLLIRFIITTQHQNELKGTKRLKVGFRDGSHRSGRRHRHGLSPLKSKHQKSNHSKQSVRRVIHTAQQIVIFNEYQNEANVNKEIGVNNDRANLTRSEIAEDYINKFEFNESHLNDAISSRYSLGGRSSFVEDVEAGIFEQQDDNLGEENFVEIVEQDKFEKLESYTDRWP